MTTQKLNTASDNYTRHRVRAREQYSMDRRAYIAAIRAQHRRAVNRFDRRYIRQQNAYATPWRHGADKSPPVIEVIATPALPPRPVLPTFTNGP